ncbi:MAG: FtsW/RodA/SpoVE family cell cycle protein [Verrucomicrobiaceae bacterium]|nr:FtsW/RodA/SpoVE family cell cycle protein [Verrucomicrobiaceae bacterium]
MTPLFRKFLGTNWLLVVNMAAIIVFGVYAIYNASSYREGALSTVWNQQIRWALIGIPVFFAAALIDYKWVRWGAWPIYLLGIVSLIVLQKYGVEVLGQKRLRVGGLGEVNPPQIAIMGGILCLSVVFGDLQRWIPVFRYPSLRMIAAGIVAGIPGAMVLKVDFGSATVWGPVFCGMLLVGSIPFRYLITLTLIVLCVVPIGYFFALKPYQQKRIDTWMFLLTNQEHKVDLKDEGWVPNFLLTAVGSAGMEGKGPLSQKVEDRASIHRTFFPNESINDFIFSVVAEEFGFRGAILLLSAMALLLLQSIFVAFCSRDQLGRLIVVGIVAMLFIHSFENAGMNILLTPITGLQFPFVSYGGTFLVVCMFMMGLVQSVWIHRNISPVAKAGADEQDEDADER